LRFYGQDPAKNLEIVQTMNVFACAACQGPKLLSLNITPANQVNDTFYTRSLSPGAKLSFNEESELVFGGFIKGGNSIELTKVPSSGLNTDYTLTMPSGTTLT